MKAVVNWLSNDSVSIVNLEAIPTESRYVNAITQVSWGSSRQHPIARVVTISGDQAVLEESAEALCELIEMKEKKGVVVSGKRPIKSNPKFQDGASAKAVAKASGGRAQLSIESKKKKTVLSDKEKEIIALKKQAAKKAEEEMFAQLNVGSGASQGPSSVKKQLIFEGPSLTKAKHGEESSDEEDDDEDYLHGGMEGEFAQQSDNDDDWQPDGDDKTEDPDSYAVNQLMEFASPANIRILRGLADLMEALNQTKSFCDVTYVRVKPLPEGQSWVYLPGSKVKVTKAALLRVEQAASSAEARLSSKKSQKKRKSKEGAEPKQIDKLAPTKAAVRALLVELFHKQDLYYVTCYGTRKMKKAISEDVLKAMWDYISDNTPDYRKISKGIFNDTINRKGHQVGSNMDGKKEETVENCATTPSSQGEVRSTSSEKEHLQPSKRSNAQDSSTSQQEVRSHFEQNSVTWTSPNKSVSSTPSKVNPSPSQLINSSPSKINPSPSKIHRSPLKIRLSPSKILSSPYKIHQSPYKMIHSSPSTAAIPPFSTPVSSVPCPTLSSTSLPPASSTPAPAPAATHDNQQQAYPTSQPGPYYNNYPNPHGYGYHQPHPAYYPHNWGPPPPQYYSSYAYEGNPAPVDSQNITSL